MPRNSRVGADFQAGDTVIRPDGMAGGSDSVPVRVVHPATAISRPGNKKGLPGPPRQALKDKTDRLLQQRHLAGLFERVADFQTIEVGA